jgi:hypothetical protein
MLLKLIIKYDLPLVFANVHRECLGMSLPALPTLGSTAALAVSPGVFLERRRVPFEPFFAIPRRSDLPA